MSPPVAPRRARVSRRQHLERERRRRRLALLTFALLVVLVIVVLSAFGGSSHTQQAPPLAAPVVGTSGPPATEIVAKLGNLNLQLPVGQRRVTAIGYQGGSEGALALDPLGRQANEGLLKRMLHAVVGTSSGRPRWYQLPGGIGPGTSSLDVGAPAGTDVYSPVDGTIVGISDVVLNGRPLGSSIDIQPNGAPSLVVTVSHVRVDPALEVGAAVTSGSTKLGAVVDYSHAEKQALARYTNDAGNHVVVEVHTSATLQIQ